MNVSPHLCLIGILIAAAPWGSLRAQQTIAVANSSFETPVQTTYTTAPTVASQGGSGWSFSGNSGISKNGTTLGLAASPQGAQAAFVQGTSSFSQAITVAAKGTIRIRFSAEASAALGGNPFQVKLDGVPLTFGGQSTLTSPTTAAFTAYESDYTAIMAGAHTLSFVGTSATGTATTFIDGVSASGYPLISPTPAGASTVYGFNSDREFTGVQPGSTRAATATSGASGFSSSQGAGGWRYAAVHFPDTGDLWNLAQPLTYHSASATWRRSSDPVAYVSATQQAMTEGDSYHSARYWTADRDYANIQISSTLLATKTVGAYIAYASAATHATTRVTGTYFPSASAISAAGGTLTVPINADLKNVRTGDRIYFVLQNYGTGSNGSGIPQTWNQSIVAADSSPNQWGYASVHFPDAGDLWNLSQPLTYDNASATWRRPSNTVAFVSATQQAMTEGDAYFSTRYWIADRDYPSVQITSTLSATKTVGAYIAYASAATHATTALTSAYFSSASTIAANGGTQNIAINATKSNVRAGDRIYFVLQNYGTGSNGHGVPQTWKQSVTSTGPMHFGVHAQTLRDPGHNFISAYLDKSNSMHALGGPGFVVRDFIQWPIVQPTAAGGVDWTDSDAAVARAQLNNQKLIFCVCFTPSWATGGLDATHPAANVVDWQNFLKACASRYKDSGVIAGWELWNEQNSPLFFESSVGYWVTRAQDYANKILIPGYDAIRTVDPVTPVLFGGMNCGGMGPDGSDNSTVGFLANVLATSMAASKFDYMGYHPYLGADSPLIAGVFDQLRKVMGDYGVNKPIVCTEWGALSPASSPTNAGIFLQTLTTLQAKGVSYACYHYSIEAEGLGYGLFEWSIAQPESFLTPNANDWKGSAYAYDAWIQILGGHTFEAAANFNGLVPANTVGYTFVPSAVSSTIKTTAVWNFSGTASVQVLVGAGATSAEVIQLNPTTFLPESTPATISGSGAAKAVTLSVSGNPSFLRVTY